MARTTQEIYAQRLAETEQTMIRLRSSYRVEKHLAEKFGVLPRQVRRWMHQIRVKWKAEATTEDQDREALRAEMHQTLNDILAQAMQRTVIVKDADGNPLLDQATKRPIVKSNPDLQRALHACIQLRNLHALDEPAKSHVKVTMSTDLNALPNYDALKPEHVEKLREIVTAIAPNGDLKDLAGEWFREDKPAGPIGVLDEEK